MKKKSWNPWRRWLAKIPAPPPLDPNRQPGFLIAYGDWSGGKGTIFEKNGKQYKVVEVSNNIAYGEALDAETTNQTAKYDYDYDEIIHLELSNFGMFQAWWRSLSAPKQATYNFLDPNYKPKLLAVTVLYIAFMIFASVFTARIGLWSVSSAVYIIWLLGKYGFWLKTNMRFGYNQRWWDNE